MLAPIGGGAPIHRQVPLSGPIFEANLIGLVMAGIDLKEGVQFKLPFLIGMTTGKSFGTSEATFQVMGRKTVKSKDGTSYDCAHVVVQNELLGEEQWWIPAEAPYWIKRKTSRSTTNLVTVASAK